MFAYFWLSSSLTAWQVTVVSDLAVIVIAVSLKCIILLFYLSFLPLFVLVMRCDISCDNFVVMSICVVSFGSFTCRSQILNVIKNLFHVLLTKLILQIVLFFVYLFKNKTCNIILIVNTV